jgi:hypothetical protein
VTGLGLTAQEWKVVRTRLAEIGAVLAIAIGAIGAFVVLAWTLAALT